MKKLIFVLLTIFITGCDKKLDPTSYETLSQSGNEIFDTLNQSEKRIMFEKFDNIIIDDAMYGSGEPFDSKGNPNNTIKQKIKELNFSNIHNN